MLTWQEGRLARAEVQHLVFVQDAEIVPLILCLERLHRQQVACSIFPHLEMCLFISLEGGLGHGTDEDDEAKGSILVLTDPGYTTVLLGALTLQLQPLSHLGVSAATKLDLHPRAVGPRAACGREILVRSAREEPRPRRANPAPRARGASEVQEEDRAAWATWTFSWSPCRDCARRVLSHEPPGL